MINDKRRDKAEAKERVRSRINADFDRSKYRYMDFYNAERPHASLQYQTPDGSGAEYMRKQGMHI